MNIAIIVIATGKYIKFFDKLQKSIEKYFLPGHEKTTFLFTDQECGYTSNVVVVPALQLPWPLPSLLRFDQFTRLDLSKYDLAYYIDADQEVVSEIGMEVVPVKGQLVGVVHPYSDTDRQSLFEANPQSAAYCNPELNTTYYHANFFGGHTEDFLKAAKECAQSVARDLAQLFIAKWYDESHLNKYFSLHPPKALPSTYGWPSHDTKDIADKKIVHFAKDVYALRAYLPTPSENKRTQGVCLLAAGNPVYGEYAYNLAASMLAADPATKITLFATPSAVATLTGEQRGAFERILDVPLHALKLDDKVYYNRFKLFLAEVSPYDHSMYFDVDSLWMSKMSVQELFDYITTFSPGLAGQCEAVIPVKKDAIIFKHLKDIKPLQVFQPPLSFIGKNFYQLHGQFLYCDKHNQKACEVLREAQRLFDAMARNQLTGTGYWHWYGQPIEELCVTLATAIVGIELPTDITTLAPVSVQSDKLTSFDPFSSAKMVMSINGSATHDEASKTGGYCMGEKETALYISHYNRKIEELQAAGFAAMPYRTKIVEL